MDTAHYITLMVFLLKKKNPEALSDDIDVSWCKMLTNDVRDEGLPVVGPLSLEDEDEDDVELLEVDLLLGHQLSITAIHQIYRVSFE